MRERWRWWDGRLLSMGSRRLGISSARIKILLLFIIILIPLLIKLNLLICR